MKKTKKILYRILTILICAVFVLTIKSDVLYDNAVSTETEIRSGLAFSVLGDIHGDTEKLKTAIMDLYFIDSNMDALILNGDIVDQGIEKQYSSVEKILKSYSQRLPKKIIKNIGNHEFFDYDVGFNNQLNVDEFLKRYFEFSGENTTYHDKWINGYHFISLGTETGNTEELGAVKAYISEKQQNWLNSKLSEGYEKGKPIFVFLHQHLSSNTKGWVGVEQGNELINILSSYPEVIIFASHTHASPEANAVTLGQPFTMVQTGAVRYTIVRNDSGERKNLYDVSYGVYVEVQGNKVIIKGRNFAARTWIYTQVLGD
jgi:Icc protein